MDGWVGRPELLFCVVKNMLLGYVPTKLGIFSERYFKLRGTIRSISDKILLKIPDTIECLHFIRHAHPQ